MRQRLGIAQALLHSPKILILDEPTNGLDPAGIREMRDYLKNIAQQEGIAVLVSSHLLSEMELMCSRVVVIQNGKFVREQLIGGAAPQNSTTEKQQLMIRVNNVQHASAVLESFQQIELIEQNAATNELLVSCSDESLARLVQELSQKQIAVYRITEIKRSLEDEFLAWTGGNQIV